MANPVTVKMLFARVKEFKWGGAIVYLPKKLIEADNYPFEDGAIVKVKIVRGAVVLTIPQWWEMLDWRKMPDAFEKLPKRSQRILRQAGLF